MTISHPAPAIDSAGNDVWNLWASKSNVSEFVITVYSYRDCRITELAMIDAGFTVLTDAI